MREVCCFLCPTLYSDNARMIEGLLKNGIAVSCLNARKDSYVRAIEEHAARVSKANTDQSAKEYQPRLCLAFEDSRRGVRAAIDAGMCAIGIASNRIELERLRSEGAHAAALSIADLLEDFHVRNYYQIQYLPYAIQLKCLAESKVGYPVSLLDTLSGRFLKHDEDGDLLQLDRSGPRIIPREILGITPDSLADVYINNIGWPQDKIDSFFLDTHELEMDIIRMLGRFYGYESGYLRGFVTNGGTEGNFSGLWWNRDFLQSAAGGHLPILLTSNQTHYSISKAAQQLAIEGRLIETYPDGAMDCEDLSRVLDEIAQNKPNFPVLMNVNAGTTQTGAIDNLPRIHELLVEKVEKRGVHFTIHMDAALLGACLPIVNPFGKVDYFRDLGVTTMALSGHKFFGSVCICGVCLSTASFLDACFQNRSVGVGYLTGLHDLTPSGSRSGFATLTLHNTLCGLYMHTNAHRLRLIVKQCYRNADYFVQHIASIVGVDAVVRPQFSLNVCFPRPSEKLMIRYQLMPVNIPHISEPLAGVCILANVDRHKIDRFLGDFTRDMIMRNGLPD